MSPDAIAITFSAKDSTSGFDIAFQSIQCGFRFASASFEATFSVGTTQPNGVPRPVVNRMRWQPAAARTVEDVLDYGECVKTHGLSLLTGPGNDLVATTVLAAAGCHLILFTTGRGTPFGCVVPTLKIASNDALANRKPHWVDWNAMSDPDVESFAEKVVAIASGEVLARNEVNGAQTIAIFKDGVTL